MMRLDQVVPRIMVLARLPDNKRRSEVERELSDHLDDLVEEARSQGYDDQGIARIVRMRFGEPDEVAAAFTSVYKAERIVRRILQSTLVVTVSGVAVALVVVTLQSIAAIYAANSVVSALRGIHHELFGFGTIVAGYCSVYAGERLFPGSSGRALLPSAALGLLIALLFLRLNPQHAALPLAAFACAACGRLLQRVDIPFVWVGGTALPLLIAWTLCGPLIPGWEFPWLVWLSLTICCVAMRRVVRVFEGVFVER